MKTTGIVRRLDELGRIVIPAELRRTFHIGVGSPMEILANGENLILRSFISNYDEVFACENCGYIAKQDDNRGCNLWQFCPECGRNRYDEDENA